MTVALVERFDLSGKGWVRSADEVGDDIPEATDTDLIITVGGDGTIIRATVVSVPHRIPILGINMGRLGFMTELEAAEALDNVPQYLEGNARIEERVHAPGRLRDHPWQKHREIGEGRPRARPPRPQRRCGG